MRASVARVVNHPLFAVAAVLAIAFAALGQGLPPAAPAASPDVLIVQLGYDGPIELAGTLTGYQYTGGHMFVEWVDNTTDGVFRNGYEEVP